MDKIPKIDGRKVDQKSLHTLRLQIVRLHETGRSNREIAQITGLTEECISRTLKKYREKGLEGLTPQKRGRRFGVGRVLNQEQEEKIRKILEEKTPDQVNLPFPLWSRDNIAMLIEDNLRVKMPLRTIIGKPSEAFYEKTGTSCKGSKKIFCPSGYCLCCLIYLFAGVICRIEQAG